MATTPDAVPGAVIEAAWGDAVRADIVYLESTKVNKAGDTMTGGLTVTGQVIASGSIGAGGSPWSNQKGAMLGELGMINVYMTDPTVNFPSIQLARTGVSSANGQQFMTFARATAANSTAGVNGSITIAASNAVAYNTTSDKRLKTLTRPVDPDEAVDKLAAVEPINYTWTDTPAEGEQVGFFAQDLYTVAPEAVTVGHGEPGEFGFQPWMVDLSKLVPTLVAAVQALTRRIEQLEGAAPS